MTSDKPPRPSRYSYESVLDEVTRVIKDQPRGTMARLARACGMDHPGFSNRLKGGETGLYFSIEHFGIIANELEAPTGWPWVEWKVGAAFDSFQKLVESSKRSGHR